jgi:hypothetical protein
MCAQFMYVNFVIQYSKKLDYNSGAKFVVEKHKKLGRAREKKSYERDMRNFDSGQMKTVK